MNASMNKRQMGILLAGLIAAAPACTATAEDVQNVETQADDLKVKTVYSSKEFSVSSYVLDPATNKSVKKMVMAKLRITIAKAGRKGVDYRYDGQGVMAHEFKIEWIDAKGDSIDYDGETYYAKATGKKGEFRLFSCASTNNCSEKSWSAKATVRVSQDDKNMTISGLGLTTDPVSETANAIVLDDAVGRSVTLSLKK
jgi:hypothetical protein